MTWWRRGKRVALDVSRALVYLHSRRIVHLDIKSANVLLTRWVQVGCRHTARQAAGDYRLLLLRLLLLCLLPPLLPPASPGLLPWLPPEPTGVRATSPSLRRSEGVAKVGDVGMAKIMAGEYVTGNVGTLAW